MLETGSSNRQCNAKVGQEDQRKRWRNARELSLWRGPLGFVRGKFALAPKGSDLSPNPSWEFSPR
jgi:hypothetical protein